MRGQGMLNHELILGLGLEEAQAVAILSYAEGLTHIVLRDEVVHPLERGDGQEVPHTPVLLNSGLLCRCVGDECRVRRESVEEIVIIPVRAAAEAASLRGE